MFNKKKHTEEQLKLIEKEKQELLRLKEILENNYPKIDLKDIYVLTIDDINYIVRMQIEDRIGIDYFKNREIGKYSKLIDIFSNKIVYEKFSYHLIDREEYVGNRKDKFYIKDDYIYLKPIIEVDKNLLAYTDGLVPTYVLINLYHKLNKVDTSSSILAKKR